MDKYFREKALQYHKEKPTGKLATLVTKPLLSKENLSLAYTPGVGACVEEIQKDPDAAYLYTNISHTCAIITNATAVLGYGQTSPRAAKPVMEGKAAIIKHITNCDAVDLVIDERNPDQFIECICKIAPSFGAIMLEDIKAPDCFYIEEKLHDRCPVPFFHDDQHGTAIVVAAALINAIQVQQLEINSSKVCILGAGAAGYAIYQLLTTIGFSKKQIIAIDSQGPLISERENQSIYKRRLINTSFSGSTSDAIKQSHIIIGVAKGDIIDQETLLAMPQNSIIFALSNPVPEIDPQSVAQWRPDILIATGRSDYPNQVNNILVFPYLIQAMLSARSGRLNDKLKARISRYIASLVQAKKDRILPDSFDSRLREIVTIIQTSELITC